MTKEVKKYGLTVQLAVLAVSLLLTSSNIINGILPQIRDGLHVSNAAAELLSTTPSLTALITLLLSPAMARFFGLKNVIGLGVALVGVSGVVPMFVSDYTVILISRIVLGLGLGCYNSLAVAIIQVMWSGDTRSTLLGIRGAFENIGQMILTALVGVLASSFGWQGSFSAYILSFAALAWFWIVVPDVKLVDDKSDDEDVAEGGDVFAEKSNYAILVLFALFAAGYLIAMQSGFVRWAAVTQEALGADFNTSTVMSIGVAAGIVSGFGFGALNKFLGDMNTLYLGIAIEALGCFLLYFANGSWPMLVASIICFYVPGPILGPWLFNQLPKYATKSQQAFWSTAIMIGFHVGIFLAPLAMTAVEAILGSSDLAVSFLPFGIALLLVIVGVFAYTHLNRARNGAEKA
ncbi:MFS transporter [Bifidobacterium stellenboschense]|uniref:MFS transporter n=1 Tax=Bifidobacterium stellenboschense TaxID=762211 RepID=A0A087DUD1_9BIFI|nr:MFS transporter [Bifidobacterium stellenboschense]KFI99131.1 MFS transporter [Bifidobacterium stellenboschense]